MENLSMSGGGVIENRLKIFTAELQPAPTWIYSLLLTAVVVVDPNFNTAAATRTHCPLLLLLLYTRGELGRESSRARR